MDPLSEKLNQAFSGRAVRKDLVQRVKKGTNIPTFVLEFLLARYCASDDTDEIEAGLEAVHETLQGNFVRPNEANSAQSTVQQKGRHKFIDKVHVQHKEQEKRHWAQMENFGSKRIAINERHYKDHKRLLESGLWCEVTVGYNTVEDDDYAFIIEDLKPIQISRYDPEVFCEARAEFTRDEWLDVLLRSVGLEPTRMNHRTKLHFLARLAPLVEANYNLVELGPRGTGKSYVYSEFSPYSTLISGGQTSTAILFYNKMRRQVGIIGFWDVIAFDEVAGIRIKDPGTVQIMKDYLANGRFSLGTEVVAQASMVFVGNLDDSIPHIVASPASDLFKPLPKEFDLAVIHRFHNYIPGWEIPPNSNDLLSNEFGLITDYLAEAFHELTKRNLYSEVKKNARLGPGFQGRDETAVYKTTAAFLKMLHPDGNYTQEEFNEYLAYAIEGRRRVKEQLNKRKADDEFADIHMAYLDPEGKRVEVFCPESKGVQETLNPQRNMPHQKAGSVTTERKGKASETELIPEPEVVLQERHYEIKFGETGHSYASIFGDYLQGAGKLFIQDPYIRKDYQIRNFLNVCEMAANTQTIKEIHLVTAADHDYQRDENKPKFEAITESLKDLGIKLTVEYDETKTKHDRELVTDTGWHIRIGRGLDIYQRMDSWYHIGASNLDLRPCWETHVDIFKAKEEK